MNHLTSLGEMLSQTKKERRKEFVNQESESSSLKE
jgi:hypothetical protein